MAHENDWVTVEDNITRKWIKKTWEGLPSSWAVYDGDCIWSDGYNTYLSLRTNNAQFVLNKTTGVWETKTWTGLTKFYGYSVWTDGDGNYYCSYKTSSTDEQYVLNRETSTWSTKTWTGLTSFNGQYVWTDGTNIYYSNGSTQKVLNKTTGAWSTKTWTGLTSFNGNNVWHDGEKTYYSYNGNHYVLNKTTGVWSTKTWTGLTSFNGQYVWTDGHDIYISYMTANQYVLDRSTDTWKTAQWSYAIESGAYVWHDGEKTYYSRGTLNDQYEFVRTSTTKTPYRVEFPELKESIDPSHFWYIDDDIPFQGGFPPLKESQSLRDEWLIDDGIPYRLDFPELKKTVIHETWFQETGWDPYRPWPRHKPIIEEVQTIESVPPVDWTKSMKQDFEFYTVDPNTWYDDKKLDNIISCNITHDISTDKRGNASITLTEAIPECYIRTYLLVTQNNILYKFCLGTFLYMTSSDSFDGMKHNITMTGYTPLVELEEQYPKIGYHVVGYTNRKHGSEAPMVTDEIRDIILENTRCEVESKVMINKPLLNDFIAGTNDNWLTVVNNILDASSLQSYILTVDEWGTIIIADAPTIDDVATSFTYNDDNSSILLPTLDTFDDIYGIPNVMEVLYVGDKNMPAIRIVVKNEDEESIVSIPRRGREIVRRYTINNIAAPLNTQSYEAVYAQVEEQAYKLLEAASTIQKTISYSHGYCDVKVGDMVLINYERAGMNNVRAKVVSQRISCKPGCQVDEQAVYTKKLWNRGV